MKAKLPIWFFPSVIISIWLVWVVAVLLHGNGWNLTSHVGLSTADFKLAGEFGDAFGSLSSLMAALAAAGAWHAVAQARIQAFENTFYSLLAHHNQIVGSTDIQARKRSKDDNGLPIYVDGEKYIGRDAYKRLLGNLRKTISSQKSPNEHERIVKGYRAFYLKYQDDLAHYFRTIYHIMRYIDNSSVSDRHFYARIVRAQLSNSEQILLMYNCSVGKGRQKFKDLVERYAMLHNISIDHDGEHWEVSTIKRSIEPAAFREDQTEQWPTVAVLELNRASNPNKGPPQTEA